MMKTIIRVSGLFLLVFGAIACTELDGPADGAGEDYLGGDYALSASDRTGGGDGDGNGGDGDGEYQPGVITAGEWRDLDHWEFWLDLRQNQDFAQALENWSLHPFDRYSFQVKDQLERAIVDAEIRLKNGDAVLWTGRTDNAGKAECWAHVYDGEAEGVTLAYEVLVGGSRVSDGMARGFDQGINEVSILYMQQTLDVVDIMFVVDATGSMGDELEYLKVELNDVLDKASTELSAMKMRYASVFYRDVDDDYLTRTHGFDEDVNQLISFIRDQEASGGGDYEEAVEIALEEALYQQNWSDEARARILFLMLDAPPHHEEQIVTRMQEHVTFAAAEGIRIVPIAASGINRDTEFLLRFMGVLSNGTYTFVTDLSGVGNDHLEPTTGEYEDEMLNDLLLRLIKAYCE